MRFVKIFKSIESELWSMEQEINKWIMEHQVEIVSVTGNMSPQSGDRASQGFSASDVLLVVVYEANETH